MRKCIVAETSAAAQSKGSGDQGRYGMIPFSDRQLVRKHGGLGLQDYWLDCWEADPYGSRYVLMPDADLKNTTHRKYRKQLKDLNLFMFETRRSDTGHQLWLLNRHGSRSLVACTRDDANAEDASLMSEDAGQVVVRDDVMSVRDDSIGATKARPQTQKGSQNASLSSHDSFHNLFNTLSLAEREYFESFIRKNTVEEIRSMKAYLSDEVYLKEWWDKFLASPEGRAHFSNQTDWTQHPDWQEWLLQMRESVPKFVAKGECFDRKTRRAIADWALERSLVWGSES